MASGILLDDRLERLTAPNPCKDGASSPGTYNALAEGLKLIRMPSVLIESLASLKRRYPFTLLRAAVLSTVPVCGAGEFTDDSVETVVWVVDGFTASLVHDVNRILNNNRAAQISL